MWQFFDWEDPSGETGKLAPAKGVTPWHQAIQFRGSSQLQHVSQFLANRPWWKIEPANELISRDGKPIPDPTEDDLTPPQCGAINGQLYVVYLPRGNQSRELQLQIAPAQYRAYWLCPRSGMKIPLRTDALSEIRQWTLPPRPEPTDEDWVLVVEHYSKGY